MHGQATAFEAACILINLMAADEQATQAALPAAPLLIALLGGGRGPEVAEHCAWALGEPQPGLHSGAATGLGD